MRGEQLGTEVRGRSC